MNKLKSYCMYLLKFLAVILFFNIIFCLNNTAISENKYPNTPVKLQQEIINAVNEGHIVDLKKCKIDATFLSNLIRDKLFPEPDKRVMVHQNGIHIENAVIIGELNLKNSEIHHEVKLLNCSFNSKVIFSRSHFYKCLSLEESKFKRESHFAGMRVDGDFIINNTKFDAKVDFHDIDIKGHFFANDAEFKDPNHKLYFNFMKVGGKVFLNKAVFCSSVEFTDADIKSHFFAYGARFNNSDQPVLFNLMKVGGNVKFNYETIFAGGVTFHGADITGDLDAIGVKLKHNNQVLFDFMKVGGNANFEMADFSDTGFVDFNNANIEGNFVLKDARFKNDKCRMSCQEIKVGGSVVLEGAEFCDVSFADADITGDLDAYGATFLQHALFASMKVGGDVFFRNTSFNANVNFHNATITGNFVAYGATFSEPARFDSMKVGNDAVFRHTSFDGPVNFSNATITGNFDSSNATFSRHTRLSRDFTEMKLGGDVYGNLGMYNKAIESYKEEIKINPENAKAHYNLGDAFIGAGKYNEGIESYTQVIKINPENAKAHYNLGVAFIGVGKYKEGIESYKEAIKINPENAKAHYNLGVAYGNLGMHNKAIESYTQVIRIDPENAKAHYNLGDAFIGARRYKDGIEPYTQVIKINPENAKAHYNLGVAFSGAGEYEEAIESYKKAISINPKDPKAHYTLGDLYNKLGRFKKAVDAYKQAKPNGHDHTSKDHGVDSFVETNVNFEAMKVGDKASFDNTSFGGRVSFSNLDITGNFSAINATFSKTADFSSMKVGSDAFFRNTSFDGSVNFRNATITGDFNSSNAKFLEPACFASMKVGSNAVFRDTSFDWSVNFRNATITGNFDSSNAKFSTHPKQSDEITVIFIDMKVGGDAILRNTIFDGNISFRNASIGDVCDFRLAKFFSLPKYAVDFTGMRVGNKVSFDKAIFVVFKDSSLITVDNISDWGALLLIIQGDIKNLTTKLLTSKLKADQLAKIKAITDVNKLTGDMQKDIVCAINYIKDNLSLYKDNKKEIDEKAIKDSPEVKEELENLKEIFKKKESNLSDSEKEDIKWFNIAILKKLFPKILSESLKKVPIAAFDKIEVGDTASFRNVFFSGDVSIAEAKINNLHIIGPELKGNKPSNEPFTLDMNMSEIKSILHIENLKLKKFLATSLHVSGTTELYNLNIIYKVSLEHSNFLRIHIKKREWPKMSDVKGSESKVLLDGMTYQHITSDRREKDKYEWETLLGIVNDSKYDAFNYKYLEHYFNKQGYPERGDRVYIAQKIKEREYLDNWPAHFINLVLGFFVDYGRHAWRCFAFAGGVVLLGIIVYWKENEMVKRKNDELYHKYNCFWYSLDLFLPFINLKIADSWMPKNNRWFAKNYMKVHSILGWILIPVGIAGLTGIIK